jgi:hypothetical protein
MFTMTRSEALRKVEKRFQEEGPEGSDGEEGTATAHPEPRDGWRTPTTPKLRGAWLVTNQRGRGWQCR